MSSCSRNPEKRIVTIPNLLSLFRLCLIPLCVWLYCVKDEPLWTTAVLFLSGLTDVVDGFIARRFNMVSDLGKVLDPIADKLTQAVMLICLVTHYPRMLIPFLAMAVKEAFSAVTGILAIKKTGKVFGAKWHGKVATVLLYIMLMLHLLWAGIPTIVSDLLIGLCTLAVLVSLVLYGAQNFHLIKKTT